MLAESRMLLFSLLAYYDCFETDLDKLQESVADVLQALKDDLAFSEISWGPVAHQPEKLLSHSPLRQSDSLIYVVKNVTKSGSPEYTIVVRGTNPVSIWSWVFEDLNVAGQTPWVRQSPHTRARNAYISKATDTAMEIHKNLSCGGKNLLGWLTAVIDTNPDSRVKINVTGHSLGGLMCAALAVWLSDEISHLGYRDRVDFMVYAYAGPTAGNGEFAAYTRLALKDKYRRFANDLDIAPRVWLETDMRTVLPSLYSDPAIELKPWEQTALSDLCDQIRALGYEQLGNLRNFSYGEAGGIFRMDYLLQAAYQHVVPYFEFALLHAPKGVTKTMVDLVVYLFSHLKSRDVEGNEIELGPKDKDVMRRELRSRFGGD